MGKKDLVSVLTFDPKGPRDLQINSPRSLKACEKMEIHPADLFVLSKKEFEEKLAEEEIETDDVDAAYKSYTKEMKEILESIAALRQEIIENGQSGEKNKKQRKDRDSKSKPQRDRRAVSAADHERDAEPDHSDSHQDSDHKQPAKAAVRAQHNEAEQEEEQAIKSKNIGKKRKAKKKRPATATEKQQPTEDMMRNFQTTQLLGQQQLEERTGKSDKNYSEMTNQPQSIRRIEEMQLKEMRRQENLIHSNQALETKKQKLLNKILFDNIKVKKLKLEKEGSSP